MSLLRKIISRLKLAWAPLASTALSRRIASVLLVSTALSQRLASALLASAPGFDCAQPAVASTALSQRWLRRRSVQVAKFPEGVRGMAFESRNQYFSE